MPVTLATLVRQPALGLSVLAGGDDLDRAIRWVHCCELADPTPYLQGGELLLCAGLWLRPQEEADDDAERYVDRLIRAGVVGLGFGIAPTHDAVPAALVDAATAGGLPLIQVPERTPFIAISQAVSDALAANQYAQVSRSARAQAELTRAAVTGGAQGLVTRLAALLGGWVLTVDAAGNVEHSAPAAAAARGPRLAQGLARLRDIKTPVSTSLAVEGEQVVVQSLRPGRRTRGYLAVGTAARMSSTQRELVVTAVSLLTLMLAPATALRAAESRLRTTIFGLLNEGDIERARRIAADLWGGLPNEPVRVIMAAGDGDARNDLLELLDAAAASLGERIFFADLADRAVLICAAYGRVRERALAAAEEAHLLTGESGVAELSDFERARIEADQALDAGLRVGRAHTAFADIAGFGLIDLLATGPIAAFAQSLLRPLIEHDAKARGDLVRSLRTWLEHNGQWDSAAVELGIHRHTLRHRMRRVEELLGRDLDAVGVRVELWTGLQVLTTRRASPRRVRPDQAVG